MEISSLMLYQVIQLILGWNVGKLPMEAVSPQENGIEMRIGSSDDFTKTPLPPLE